MQRKYSEEIIKTILKFRAEGLSYRNILPEIRRIYPEANIPDYKALRNAVYDYRKGNYKEQTEAETIENNNWRETRERDVWVIESRDSRICTVEDAIKKAGVDMTVWELERVIVNGYDVTMKLKQGDKEKPFRAQNQQIKIVLKRKIPLPIQLASESLIKKMQNFAPKYEKILYNRVKDAHMVEVSVFDVHFGLLAWKPESGENYDLHIAESVYKNAVEDLVNKVSNYEIEYFLFPVGNDFLTIDSPKRTTYNETPQDVDGRYAKIVEIATAALIRAIDFMTNIAPVKILWIPSNHDRVTAFHLTNFLRAWYKNCPNIEIDKGLELRKYHRYGINLLGFTHGDEFKFDRLPTIMAAERPEDWAQTKYREWHLGHWHKRKELRYTAVDSHVGVPVRILPSLCGTDYWHYSMGFVGKQRAAEAYLWSKDKGYTGHFSSNV